MKDLYKWVHFHTELSQKIADNDEDYLRNAAKQVAWRPEGPISQLLNYGDRNIDPFSFFYSLATNNDSVANRTRLYESVREVFALESQLPLDNDEAFTFPTPRRVRFLFHGGQDNPDLLWRLFRCAVTGIEHINAEDFEGALKITNVALTKLTQALFLINANYFVPIDNHTTSLGCFPFTASPKRVSFAEYLDLEKILRSSFPECAPFEINLFAYLRTKGLAVNPVNWFQISTNVYDDGTDHWPDFSIGNHVFTGGAGQNNQYPLDKPEPGDVILVRFGRKAGRGIGVVQRNDYHENGWYEDGRLHVVWLNKASATLSDSTATAGFSHAGEATQAAFRNADEYASTFELLDRLSKDPEERLPLLKSHPRNRILYGPPGTGKTWHANNLALEIVNGTQVNSNIDRDRFNALRFNPDEEIGQIAMVTFHQNFGYEDFVEGIRPKLDKDSLSYTLHCGLFKRIAEAASNHSDKRYVLIIDEINRGNIAKIFGELITLIEDSRRINEDDETFVTLPYSGDIFGVPENLYLIGTMNTADRSIQLLDTALRRRFAFIEMMPDPHHGGIATDVNGVDCQQMLAEMNKRISAVLDREHQIGHTYLLNVKSIAALAEAFQVKILPLLQEYFYDDWAKIRFVLANNAFVKQRDVPNRQMRGELIDEDRKLFERLPTDDDAWRDAAEYQRIYENGVADEPQAL